MIFNQYLISRSREIPEKSLMEISARSKIAKEKVCGIRWQLKVTAIMKNIQAFR